MLMLVRRTSSCSICSFFFFQRASVCFHLVKGNLPWLSCKEQRCFINFAGGIVTETTWLEEEVAEPPGTEPSGLGDGARGAAQARCQAQGLCALDWDFHSVPELFDSASPKAAAFLYSKKGEDVTIANLDTSSFLGGLVLHLYKC